nr:adenosylcobinamide-phosphate synthase CbiB [cf. Phormidesmis sp. LEGE 11477]
MSPPLSLFDLQILGFDLPLSNSLSFSSSLLGSSEGHTRQAALLIAAAGLDFVVGDPWSWPHPVQAIGKVVDIYAKAILKRGWSLLGLRLAGVGLAILVIGGTGGLSWLGLRLLASGWPAIAWAVEVVLLASCFAGRSLRQAAADVLTPLESSDIESARQRLALYVGRDTQQLSAPEIYRAILETVSENAIDGVLAPLFFAILGALVGASAPLALAYKAASTLDSMVGYKEAPYTDLGWFSARLEDGLTWLPCRISVLAVALLSGRSRQVLQICRRDAPTDPSPNAGWSECAYAAALGVQLGGDNTYRGQIKRKPLLGNPNRAIAVDVIKQALKLTRYAFLLGLTLGVLMLLITFE